MQLLEERKGGILSCPSSDSYTNRQSWENSGGDQGIVVRVYSGTYKVSCPLSVFVPWHCSSPNLEGCPSSFLPLVTVTPPSHPAGQHHPQESTSPSFPPAKLELFLLFWTPSHCGRRGSKWPACTKALPAADLALRVSLSL